MSLSSSFYYLTRMLVCDLLRARTLLNNYIMNSSWNCPCRHLSGITRKSAPVWTGGWRNLILLGFFILPVSQAVEWSVRLFVGFKNLPPHCIEWHILEGKQEIIVLESNTNSHCNKRTPTVCVSLERNLSTLYLPGFSDNNWKDLWVTNRTSLKPNMQRFITPSCQ